MNPFLVFINTYAGTGAAGNSLSVTFSFANTAGFEALIPIKVINPTNVSVGPIVNVARSTDGGANWETDLSIGQVFSLAGGATQRKDLFLAQAGLYLISVLVGGGSTATWSVAFGETIQLVSAYA